MSAVAPYIGNLNGIRSAGHRAIVFSAIVSDYDLNVTSVILTTFDGSNVPDLAASHLMTSSGTHYVVSLALTSFTAATVYY